jgi:hypothetical protein
MDVWYVLRHSAMSCSSNIRWKLSSTSLLDMFWSLASIAMSKIIFSVTASGLLSFLWTRKGISAHTIGSLYILLLFCDKDLLFKISGQPKFGCFWRLTKTKFLWSAWTVILARSNLDNISLRINVVDKYYIKTLA